MKRASLFILQAALAVLWSTVALAKTVHYYYTDPQGTVLAKTDASGHILVRSDYRPYGRPVQAQGALPTGPGYTGHVNDPDTGLVYMQARYYDPEARMLSVDPVAPVPGDVFGFNRYAYTNNNPIINTDPTGECVGQHRADDPCNPEPTSPRPRPSPEVGPAVQRMRDTSDSKGGTSIQPSLGSYETNESLEWFTNVDAMGNPGGGNPLAGLAMTSGVGGFAALASGGIAYDAIGGAEGVSSGAAAFKRNVSVDGPSPGLWHGNGRIIGLRWRQSQWGIRLDLHPLKGDPTPILHLNIGPLGRGESNHIILFDPRWFRVGK